MQIEIRFKPGDEAFVLDDRILAPVGPVRVREVEYRASTDDEPVTKYHFGPHGSNVSRLSRDVFATHAEAVAAAIALQARSRGIAAPRTASEFHGLPGTGNDLLLKGDFNNPTESPALESGTSMKRLSGG